MESFGGRAWKRDDQGRKLVDSSGKILVTDNTQYLGCAEPKWTGSFGSNFRIQNLQLVSCLMHVLEELFIREHGIERQRPVLLPNLPKDVKDII